MNLEQITTQWVAIGNQFDRLPNGSKREKLYKKWVWLEREMYTMATKEEIQKVITKSEQSSPDTKVIP